MSPMLPHYRVDVDRATGDWLTTPEYLGHVDRDKHLQQQDTDDVHFDTHEVSDERLPVTTATWAITVVWKD